jgi:glucose-1-phosphate thymidylyltransferase
MKGIILAGGLGTRLYPLTKITNKHLLPVYDKPMILYPLNTLIRAGIKEIMIISGKEYASHFMNFLGSGKDYGAKISFAIQDTNDGGIADALKYARDFAYGHDVAVILGDNIFYDDFHKAVSEFKSGATIFIKQVKDLRSLGVPVFDKSGKKIVKVEEKPKKPKSNYGQTGFFLFDKKIFDIIEDIKPSARGQLEITDAINRYIDAKEINHHIIKKFWLDAGTIESLHNASVFIKKNGGPK